jgi:hypothetical protein
MDRGGSRVARIGGVCGVVVIAAGQTKPEDAISNIAGWLHVLGIDRVPPSIANAQTDTWVTVAGVMLLLASLGWGAWGRWGKKLRRSNKGRSEQRSPPSDNTFIGTPSEALQRGSRNTFINTADANGNVLLNRGGTAIGAGSRADSTSVAIGANAGGGAPNRTAELAERAHQCSQSIYRSLALYRQSEALRDEEAYRRGEIIRSRNSSTTAFMAEYAMQYGALAVAILRRGQALGLGVSASDISDAEHPTNPIGVEHVARALGVLSERIKYGEHGEPLRTTPRGDGPA